MPRVIDQLNQDHGNIAKLLAIVEQQMAVFHRGDHPDYELMLSVLDYARNYSGQVHHPAEDLVYRRLVKRDPSSRAEIRDILAEHETLARLTREFAELIEGVLNEVPARRDQIEQAATAFIDAYRRHIEIEDSELFPRALSALSEQDWDEIDAAVTAPADPLFSGEVAERYRALREQILRLSLGN